MIGWVAGAEGIQPIAPHDNYAMILSVTDVTVLRPAGCDGRAGHRDPARGAGRRSNEAPMPKASNVAIIPSDQLIGNLPPNRSFSHTIFSPTKIKMKASEYFSR